MPIEDARALQRMKQSVNGLADLRWKIWQLRRLFLGDQDALDAGRGVGINQDSSHETQRPDRNYQPDIMVQDLREGRSSDLLNLMSSLVFKVYYNFPTVRLTNVKPKERAVNAQWLTRRLGPSIDGGCNAMEHGQVALLDYVISGMGAIYVGIGEGGVPYLRWVDVLDLSWDLTARLLPDARWMSVSVVNPLHVWLAMYPDAIALQKLVNGPNRDKNGRFTGGSALDRPITLDYYYDIDEGGAHKVFLKAGEDTWDSDAVYSGETPYLFDDMGTKKPFIPVETITFIAAPGSRWGVGPTEKMIPSQAAIWGLTEAVQNNIAACKAFIEVDMKKVDATSIQDLLDGVEGGLVKVKDGNAIRWVPGAPVQQAILEELARQKLEAQTQSGVSPSLTGSKQPGHTTATEIMKISAQGELTAATVSSANARLFERCAKKMLWVGKRYDTSKFDCRIGETVVPFGAGTQLGPVKDYLKPDARVTVSEDDMRFRSETEQLAKAEAEVNLAAKFAQLYPNWLPLALRGALEAFGRDNVDEALEPPKQPVQPGLMPAAQPGQVQPGQGQTTVG